MKTLEEYHVIREFLGAQGLQPTVAMLAASEPEWKDLHFLATEWKAEIEADTEAREAEREGLSEEELGLLDRLETDREQLEQENLLFHSSGYKPRST